MASRIPSAPIHRAGGRKVAGLGSGYGAGGAAVRISVNTAQARSFLSSFQKESRGLRDWVAKEIAERVAENARKRVTRQSTWSPRPGRSPKNILRPSAGGDAIKVVSDRERMKMSTQESSFTVFVSTGQAHLLEYGVDPHWQRMRRIPHKLWVSLGDAFASGELTKDSPWRHGLFRHPGHAAKPFLVPSVKAARGWANRQGKVKFRQRFNAARLMARVRSGRAS